MKGIYDVKNHKKSNLENLKTAAKKLGYWGYVNLKILKDPKGAFSVEYPKFFLTANSYAWKGYIVSNQIEIIKRAILHKKDILLYVGNLNKFYIFDPQVILDTGVKNIHGYLTMVNYDIKLGKEFRIEGV